ncbi:MAG: hypothetical protein HYV63_11340 [Candidatus Schekmanbacteria bacterium]|nr:hypothetical protein [Candidatus Schekmanbacteria bacterium]
MRTSCYLPTNLCDDVKQVAEQDGKSFSAVIQEAVRYYLDEGRRRRAGEALARAAEQDNLSAAEAAEALRAIEEWRHDDDRF